MNEELDYELLYGIVEDAYKSGLEFHVEGVRDKDESPVVDEDELSKIVEGTVGVIFDADKTANKRPKEDYEDEYQETQRLRNRDMLVHGRFISFSDTFMAMVLSYLVKLSVREGIGDPQKAVESLGGFIKDILKKPRASSGLENELMLTICDHHDINPYENRCFDCEKLQKWLKESWNAEGGINHRLRRYIISPSRDVIDDCDNMEKIEEATASLCRKGLITTDDCPDGEWRAICSL